jgi:hypothetical protein
MAAHYRREVAGMRAVDPEVRRMPGRRLVHLLNRCRRHLDLLRIQGRAAEGLSHASVAMSLDPVPITLRVRRAMQICDVGRFHEAAAEAAGASALDSTKQQPLHSMAVWVEAVSHQQVGRLPKSCFARL